MRPGSNLGLLSSVTGNSSKMNHCVYDGSVEKFGLDDGSEGTNQNKGRPAREKWKEDVKPELCREMERTFETLPSAL